MLFAGCSASKKCRICDDTYRVESYKYLIAGFEELIANEKDPKQKQELESMVHELRKGILFQMIRCLQKHNAKIANEINYDIIK